MRVLYIEDAFGFGGSLTGLLELIDNLPAEIQPSLACSFDATRHVSISPRISYHHVTLPKIQSTSTNVLTRLWQHYWQYYRPWARELENLIRANPPDIIHCNNGSLKNFVAACVGRRKMIPVISHQKGFEYEGKLNRWALRNSLYTCHIGTSPAISRHLRSLGLSESKLTTMFEPIQPPKQWRRSEVRHIPVIGMHSMLTPWKGQDVFLRAIGVLNRSGARRFRVAIAGSANGLSEYATTLFQIAESEGVADLVDFRGHVSNVYGFLSELDVAVHAAVQPEPFGRVVAEAMICGVPVIVSDIGGPGEYVEHGVTGFRVPMGNAEALAITLAELLDDPDRRRSIGDAGRRFALATFDPVRLGREMANFYERVLRNPL